MTAPRLGLRENLGQFSLLVLLNAFVGSMVGLERTILQSTAQGLPIYQRMGYRTVTRVLVYSS